MYLNRAPDGTNNLCGKRVAQLRKQMIPKVSQRTLAAKLQLLGLDIDHYAIQRIENGRRFVTDIELAALAELFGISSDELLR